MLVQVLDEFQRLHKERLRDEVSRRTEAERRIEFFKAGIQIKRRLVSENSLRRESQHFRELIDIVIDRSVAADNALRDTGRSGCKYDIERIRVDRVLIYFIKRRRIDPVIPVFCIACSGDLTILNDRPAKA